MGFFSSDLGLAEQFANPKVSRIYEPSAGNQPLSEAVLGRSPFEALSNIGGTNQGNNYGGYNMPWVPDLGDGTFPISPISPISPVTPVNPEQPLAGPESVFGTDYSSSSDDDLSNPVTGDFDFDALGSVFGIENLTDKIGGLFEDQNIISSEGINLNNLFGTDKDFSGYDFLNITPSEIQKSLITSFLPGKVGLVFNLFSALSKAFPSTQPNPFVNQETGELDYSKMFDSGMLSTIYDEEGAPNYSYGTIDGIGVEAPSPDTLEEAVDQGLPFGQEGDESWTPGGGVVYHSSDYDWNSDGVDDSNGGFDNGADSASSIGASDYSADNYGGDGGWSESDFSSDFGFDW